MLGLWLIEQNIITEKALDHALSIQMQSGGRLGDILVANGATTPIALYKAIAHQANLPFVDLLKTEWNTALLRTANLNDYIRLRLLPSPAAPRTEPPPRGLSLYHRSQPRQCISCKRCVNSLQIRQLHRDGRAVAATALRDS